MLVFDVDYAAFSICHLVEVHWDRGHPQQVYLLPLLRGKIVHQGGPDLFLPLASVMKDDRGSIELFGVYSIMSIGLLWE